MNHPRVPAVESEPAPLLHTKGQCSERSERERKRYLQDNTSKPSFFVLRETVRVAGVDEVGTEGGLVVAGGLNQS